MKNMLTVLFLSINIFLGKMFTFVCFKNYYHYDQLNGKSLCVKIQIFLQIIFFLQDIYFQPLCMYKSLRFPHVCGIMCVRACSREGQQFTSGLPGHTSLTVEVGSFT